MNSLPLLLLISFAGNDTVAVETLNGDRHSGQLSEISDSEVKFIVDGRQESIPIREMMQVRFVDSEVRTLEPPQQTSVQLRDQSRVSASAVSIEKGSARLVSPLLGSISLPSEEVVSLRFAKLDSAIQKPWAELTQRERTRDSLVVRKSDVLDHLDGVIGDIDEKSVRFLIDSEEIPLQRSKVFGLIFARRKSSANESVARVELVNSDVVRFQTLTWSGNEFSGTLVGGSRVKFSSEVASLVDFSAGKVAFLSQLEPREVSYTPYFDYTFEYIRDKNRDGGPLRLGKQSFSRGLNIHSRTQLRYRLAKQYRRFQTVVGIDELVAPRGDVHLVIKGDEQTLFDADISGLDEPQRLDLDVSDVLDLEILVDFGRDHLDISDHLNLADAKLIK